MTERERRTALGQTLAEAVAAAVDAAVDEVTRGLGLPRLRWSLDLAPHGDGQLHLRGQADDQGVVERWATALDLSKYEYQLQGSLHYGGPVGPVYVTVWCPVERQG